MPDETTSPGPEHAAPGGGSSRGPESSTVGETQVDVMPHDEHRAPNNEESLEGVQRAFDASNAPPPDPNVPVSKEELQGMSSTEMNPVGPLGVGQSRGGRGEDLAPDRPDTDSQGPAGRPAGQTAQDNTGDGVNPNPNVTPGSPDMQSGDQAG